MKKELFMTAALTCSLCALPKSINGTLFRDATIDPFALGIPVSGATVTVTVPDTLFSTTTDETGSFSLSVSLPVSASPVRRLTTAGVISLAEGVLTIPAGIYRKITVADLRGRVLFASPIEVSAQSLNLPTFGEGVKIVKLTGATGNDRLFKWAGDQFVSGSSAISSSSALRSMPTESPACTLTISAAGYAPIKIPFADSLELNRVPSKLHLIDSSRGAANDIGVTLVYGQGGTTRNLFATTEEPYRLESEKAVWPLLPNSIASQESNSMAGPTTLCYLLTSENCYTAISRADAGNTLGFADLDRVDTPESAIFGTVIDFVHLTAPEWAVLNAETNISRSDFYRDTIHEVVYAPGIKLTLTDTHGVKLAETTTDSLGRYRFDAVPDGEYRVVRSTVILSGAADQQGSVWSGGESIMVNTTKSRRADMIGGGFIYFDLTL